LPPPATAKNVISVGAHQSDVGHMTTFSSWGPTDDGRMKPDISAPGCQQGGDFGITSTSLAGGYLSMCGTSQAAPVIAGSIAALLSEWRSRFAGEPRPATYKALLGCFAEDRANAGPDYRFGLGAVNLLASVNELRTATTVEAAIDDGFTDTYVFHVPAGAGDTLIVTLAWDDPAAAELASVTLVNDLDLELVAPTAGTFQAYVLDPAQPDSLAVRGRNARDNLEQVRVIGPEAGEWTARVIAWNVPAGPQEYSLVGLDTAPPADPAAVAATAVSDTTVLVAWIRPGDADRAGTLVVRSTDPVTWLPEDGVSYVVGAEPSAGVFVVAADDVDHQSTALVDEPLAPGTLHHYALFAYDEVPNYSPGLADTAQTSADAVDAPLIAAADAAPRFFREGSHPSRGAATLRFELPGTRRISVDVYDASGRHVVTLLRGERAAGSHRVEWSGRTDYGVAPAGVYFVRFRTEGLTATEKIVRVR
ncbi:MAG: S8 family serine peptidase, partial [Candidatus Eiseniibacteriota bacterium]